MLDSRIFAVHAIFHENMFYNAALGPFSLGPIRPSFSMGEVIELAGARLEKGALCEYHPVT
jgi:hypothetical protein